MQKSWKNKKKIMATTVYKKGSKGDGVMEIQSLLRIAGYTVTVDGDFGARTEKAVRYFQEKMKLSPADGIVGPATMQKLRELQKESTSEDVNITPCYINTHITFCVGRPVKYIAIHYTAGSSSAGGRALLARNVFLQRSASADFIVDDSQIIQINPDIRNYYCWAVGDKKNTWTGGASLNGRAFNKNTVSIEICSNLKKGTSAAVPNHDGWFFSDASIENARRLVRHLMKAYGIPKENVVRHYDITGKTCPGVPGWNDGPLYTPDGKPTTRKNNSLTWQAFHDSL